MYAFDFHRAKTIDDAAEQLGADENARLLAGGMSLIPVLRLRLGSATTLIDLNGLDELRGITATPDGFRIGAMTTHYAVSASPMVREMLPALALLASRIGDPLVRNRGTIGGSLAHNDPAACYPSALLGLGGSIETTRRIIDADNFIKGSFETALEPGELIVAVNLNRPDRAAHIKFANKASRLNIVGVFVAQRGGEVRVGITGAGHYAFRPGEFERRLTHNFAPEAIRECAVSVDNLASDIHASAAYRAHLVKELTMQAVDLARGATAGSP
jgi:carbon-monoxide dehydrogenase medium subunit